MIDVHAHILPGIDDGSRSMEESVEMLHMLAEQGFTAVIATPHSSRRKQTDGLAELVRLVEEKVREAHPGFSVFLGQEHWYDQELSGRLRSGAACTMAGSSYVLIEFAPSAAYSAIFQGVRRLTGAGYIPVLAHVERYGCLEKEERIRELESCGCAIQMNYSSLKGHWYQAETRRCRRLVENGRIHLLGTDMHRMDFRPPETMEPMRWLRDHIAREYLELLTTVNPMRIIRQESIL